MKPKNTIPAVENTLNVIEYMVCINRPCSMAELTTAAKASTTTGYRIVQSLIAHGWLEKTKYNKYQLATAHIASLLEHNINIGKITKFQTVLNELAERTELSAKFSVRRLDKQVSILRASPPSAISVAWEVGAKFPVIEGSVGAALLSCETDETIRDLCAACDEDIPEKHDADIIIRRINALREQGYVTNSKANRWHVNVLSVPVKTNAKDVFGAITLISLGTENFAAENVARYLKRITKAVRACEAILKTN